MRTHLFGYDMPHPILLAPASSHLLADREGEVATVRGAGAADAITVISTLSNRSIEDIAEAATAPTWFQLYVQSDRGRTEELIQRAEAAGCRALCITVDLPMKYARTREDRMASDVAELPFPNLNLTAKPGGKGRGEIFNRAFNWRDLEWIQAFAKTPVILKGILNPDDADRAAKSGVAGIIVSNHGGRALDSVPASIDALPHVADKVAGRIPILMDGGIRRGTDVLKALALGASAVLIGRPYLYALAVAGPAGVTHVLEILKAELEAAMALCGCTSLRSVGGSVLWPSSHDEFSQQRT
jgi:4-hydroxymandelate oxidase